MLVSHSEKFVTCLGCNGFKDHLRTAITKTMLFMNGGVCLPENIKYLHSISIQISIQILCTVWMCNGISQNHLLFFFLNTCMCTKSTDNQPFPTWLHDWVINQYNIKFEQCVHLLCLWIYMYAAVQGRSLQYLSGVLFPSMLLKEGLSQRYRDYRYVPLYMGSGH